MPELSLVTQDADRVDGYRQARNVALLTIAVLEIDDYGVRSEEDEPEAIAQTLAMFGRRATEVIEREYDGLLVRFGGGQLLAAFAEPSSAVRAVWALRGGPLPLRGGIHLGQVATIRVGLHVDVFGRHAHRASCVAQAAHSGEILVTEPVAENAGGWSDAADEASVVFVPRGRVELPGSTDALELFALGRATQNVAAGTRPEPAAFIELDAGDGRRPLFDAAIDRKVMLGRSATCDLPISDEGCSRRHACIIYDRRRWVIQDLESTNTTMLNGQPVRDAMPLAAGDEIQIGKTVITVTRLAAAEADVVQSLRVDLKSGIAEHVGRVLPLSAAELLWFAHLACARAAGGEGWVVAGQDGHPSLRDFALPLWGRPWTAAVRTRPLLDLVAGKSVDDEDLRNLRGKTVQKLKRFGVSELVPESDGRNKQRLRLPPAGIAIVDA